MDVSYSKKPPPEQRLPHSANKLLLSPPISLLPRPPNSTAPPVDTSPLTPPLLLLPSSLPRPALAYLPASPPSCPPSLHDAGRQMVMRNALCSLLFTLATTDLLLTYPEQGAGHGNEMFSDAGIRHRKRRTKTRGYTTAKGIHHHTVGFNSETSTEHACTRQRCNAQRHPYKWRLAPRGAPCPAVPQLPCPGGVCHGGGSSEAVAWISPPFDAYRHARGRRTASGR